MRKTVVCFTILFVSLTFVACKQKEATNTNSAVETDQTQKAAAQVKGGTLKTPFSVEVTFKGLIVHVFGDDIGRKNRAVVLADSDHPVELFVPAGIDTSQLPSLGITAGSPSGGSLELMTSGSSSFSGFAIRIVGWDPSTQKVVSLMSPMLDRSQTSFNQYVPRLQKVTGGDLDQSKLKSSLFDPVPDNNDWALFFELDGGTLTAEKACKQSKFVADYEGKGMRDFAQSVKLAGTVDVQPAIQFLAKGGTWQTVTFTTLPSPPASFSIKAISQSASGLRMSHFPKFGRMYEPPPKRFDDIVFVACDDKGPSDPACSNNQWP